jgi:hypothetical protein
MEATKHALPVPSKHYKYEFQLEASKTHNDAENMHGDAMIMIKEMDADLYLTVACSQMSK